MRLGELGRDRVMYRLTALIMIPFLSYAIGYLLIMVISEQPPKVTCPECGHARKLHGRRGCAWGDGKGKECPCTRTNMSMSRNRGPND